MIRRRCSTSTRTGIPDIRFCNAMPGGDTCSIRSKYRRGMMWGKMSIFTGLPPGLRRIRISSRGPERKKQGKVWGHGVRACSGRLQPVRVRRGHPHAGHAISEDPGRHGQRVDVPVPGPLSARGGRRSRPRRTPGHRVGIMTVNAAALTQEHLTGAGIGDIPIAVAGMESEKEFTRVLLGNELVLDVDAAREEHVRVARRLVAEHSDIGAIVLE